MKLSDGSGEVYYDAIALTGFLSKELNFADTDPFSKIYEKVVHIFHHFTSLLSLFESIYMFNLYIRRIK